MRRRRCEKSNWWLAVALLLASAAAAEPVDPSHHWPLPPGELEERLAAEDFEVIEVAGGVGGVTGVKKLQIRMAEDGRELAVKWKKAPSGNADGWNNTPRKEIAAYEIQKWFLDPGDYVVPTTAARCIPPERYGPIEQAQLRRPPRAPRLGRLRTHTIDGTRCALGVLVIWIDAVTVPSELHDADRFRDDPLYARHLADFNLLTYLINHEDGREGNFLVSELEQQRRVFSIDNGVTFGARVKNFLVPNWNEIRVPALREKSIERLRALGDEQYEALGVLIEMKADRAGVLRPVPPGENAGPKNAVRLRPGWIQLGLNESEIQAVRERVDRLLKQVDEGKLATF